jgi:hypothetical protein
VLRSRALFLGALHPLRTSGRLRHAAVTAVVGGGCPVAPREHQETGKRTGKQRQLRRWWSLLAPPSTHVQTGFPPPRGRVRKNFFGPDGLEMLCFLGVMIGRDEVLSRSRLETV